ncbi:MAG: serine protease [Candidatus Binatia bacterium]
MNPQTCRVQARRFFSFAALTAVLLGSAIAASPISAADFVTKEVPLAMGNGASDYWTPERLANAQPLVLPEASAASVWETTAEAIMAQAGSPVSSKAHGPLVKVTPDRANKLFNPISVIQQQSGSAVEPQDKGTFNSHFTSSRLTPIGADTAYPYRTVGKLFFTQPGVGNFVCSASVIQRRVVLTAGHCVHKGSGSSSGFYTNFLFVPAYRDGVAPFGPWEVAYVTTTSAWATGGGVVPNAADYAMFEMQDSVIESTTRRIGEVTGWLGWQTQSLIPNHAHLLGYPASFDSGAKMHQVTAGSYRAVTPNNAEYGSDMTGGSSGGPWVQNFGAKAAGQLNGLNPGRNMVIGVTSYGYVSANPKVQGSSIPDSRFVNIFNTICAHRAGNCE